MHGRYHVYHATVRPWLWFLTRTADCRIFQEQTVPDIIKEVFGDHSVADFKYELTGNLPQVDLLRAVPRDRLQFVSRLMEQEGIYYYFAHDDGAPHAGAGRLAQRALRRRPATRSCTSSRRQAQVQPEHGARQRLALRARDPARRATCIDDYDFERPSVDLAAEQKRSAQARRSTDYEVYDYPGDYIQKRRRRAATPTTALDELQTPVRAARAARATRAALAAGRLFKLDRPAARRPEPRVPGRWRRRISWSSANTKPADGGAARATAAASLRCSQQAAVPPARAHAQAVRAGPADGGRGGPERRGDLHRQVRPREGAVPLGPLGQEGREQLVLGPRLAPLGRQELGHDRTSRASARK